MDPTIQVANILFPILVLAVWLLIWSSICRHLQGCFQGVPHAYRKLRPGLVWLLLIPGITVIWTFVVFPALFRSYQCCLRAMGQHYTAIFDQTIAITFGVVSAYVTAAGVLEPGQITRWGYWVICSLVLLGVILFRNSRLRERAQKAITASSPAPTAQMSAEE